MGPTTNGQFTPKHSLLLAIDVCDGRTTSYFHVKILQVNQKAGVNAGLLYITINSCGRAECT